MAYYSVCRYCGVNLDPGEKCTCREEKRERRTDYAAALDALNEWIRVNSNDTAAMRRYTTKKTAL